MVIYDGIYQFDTLEAAYRAAFTCPDILPYDVEEWLINLQNHLIWGSYEPGIDPKSDAVISLVKEGELIGKLDAGNSSLGE